MATRLPVLSTRVSAIPEVVEEGVTGLLVPPSNSESLAAGFLKLARDPGLCAQLGAAGASRVEGIFGLDRMVEETLAVYAEVVDS
jgi:glycosyltransferase involved in cell wall biosynthesis